MLKIRCAWFSLFAPSFRLDCSGPSKPKHINQKPTHLASTRAPSKTLNRSTQYRVFSTLKFAGLTSCASGQTRGCSHTLRKWNHHTSFCRPINPFQNIMSDLFVARGDLIQIFCSRGRRRLLLIFNFKPKDTACSRTPSLSCPLEFVSPSSRVRP